MSKGQELERQRELELQRKKEEEETRKYEDAVRHAIEEGRRLAQQKKIAGYLSKSQEYVTAAKFEDALKEVTKIFRLDPMNMEAREFENTIYAAREEHLRREQEAHRLQEEQQAKVEEIRRKLEEQTKQEQIAEQHRASRESKVKACLQRAKDFVREGAFDKALTELETAYAIDPGNAAAQELEASVLEAQKRSNEAEQIAQQRKRESETWKSEEAARERNANEERAHLRRESFETYRGILRQAWVDGQPTAEERVMLDSVRLALDIEETEQALVEREVQIETYTEALRSAYRSGIVKKEDASTHENLRQLFGMTLEEHEVIEGEVLREVKRGVKN